MAYIYIYIYFIYFIYYVYCVNILHFGLKAFTHWARDTKFQKCCQVYTMKWCGFVNNLSSNIKTSSYDDQVLMFIIQEKEEKAIVSRDHGCFHTYFCGSLRSSWQTLDHIWGREIISENVKTHIINAFTCRCLELNFFD